MLTIAVDWNGTIRPVEIPDPIPSPYQALIQTEAACICNATDTEIVEGRLPAVQCYPTLLGHENVGMVVAVGNRVTSYHIGDRVVGGLLLTPTDPAYSTGFGGFSQYVLADDYAAMQHDNVLHEKPGDDVVCKIMRVVPPDIPVEAAAMLCTWREVLGSFTDMGLLDAKRLIIFGGGPVGQSFVRFARLLGMEFVGLVDSHENRRALAISLGADDVFTRDDPRLLLQYAREAGHEIDAVIDAVGKKEILQTGLQIIRQGGAVCVYGLLGCRQTILDTRYAPRNWRLAMHQWPVRESEASAQQMLCDWIRSGQLRWHDFIQGQFPATETAKAMAQVRSREILKALLRF